MHFIYYQVLFLMLIPSFVLMYLIITKKSKIENYFSKIALKKLSISNQYFSNRARNIMLFLSLVFMIIALARPVINEKEQNIESQLNPVIIAIDVSKSMMAIDIYPNRLEFAKSKVMAILENSKTQAIGVILFAKSSFLLSAVTQDFNSLKMLINNLDTGINFDNGTNIYSTIEATEKLLKEYSSKNLILLTDGGDENNFEEEIVLANKNNINIYVLATATTNGSPIKESNGNFLTDKNKNIVNVKLNENIKELALKTNGGFINFSLNLDDINQILEDINLKSKKEDFNQKKYKTYTELFYYPLGIGIFLLLIAFSSLPNFTKNKTLILVVFSLIFIQKPLYSFSIMDFKTIENANQAYENQEYQKASSNFQKIDSNEYRDYNLANSFYKSNEFEKAIDLYKNIKTSSNDLEFKRLHNLGNAYAKNKNFNEAINSYEKALELKNDKTTKENLELVKKLLENKKENKQNQENDNSKKEENKEQEKQKEEKKNESQNNEEKSNNQQKSSQASQLEEKWLKNIKNQKTNSLLKKMESSKGVLEISCQSDKIQILRVENARRKTNRF